MSKSSRIRICLLVCCLKVSIMLLFFFCFQVIFVLLMLVLYVPYRCNQSFSALFLMSFSSRCIDVSTLSWILASPFPPWLISSVYLIFGMQGLMHSPLVFLFCGPFVEVLLSSTLRMVLSILRRGQPGRLSLWWDFYVVSSSFLVLLRYFFFNFFLSSSQVWSCLISTSPSICKFPFLQAFQVFLDFVVLFLM